MEKYGNFELFFFEKLQGLKIGWGIMNYAKVSTYFNYEWRDE
ncbi:COG2827: putative endonuclease containing a URI domain [Bathymodiolus heckerae thiotrophic gill symbiont]|nr:COG2827: putative endonuclease containing a URI domain [Bathymodiolus heckerae thiotrophic gill symbiont]